MKKYVVNRIKKANNNNKKIMIKANSPAKF